MLRNWQSRAQTDYGYINSWDTLQEIGLNEYFNKYLKPYFNIQKVCTSLEECGYKQIYFCNGNPYPNLFINQDRIFFTTIDGYGFSFVYNDTGWQAIRVDINGAKGPNKQGRDIFELVLTNDKGFQPSGYQSSQQQINSDCSKSGLGDYCLLKIMQDGWQFSKDYGCW